MKKQLIKDAWGWGLLLWLIGYVVGIGLFFLLPSSMIGWAIMPIGVIITLWVLIKKVHSSEFHYYIYLALIWTFIAVLFDYLFIVQALKPVDGYYKLDVYLYYLFTFMLPVLVGWWKR